MTELPFQRERPDATVATPLSFHDLARYGAILDARSPSEFAEDHLPGAINAPVLDDEEREHVTTIQLQQWSGAPDAGRWVLKTTLKVPAPVTKLRLVA